MKQGRFASKTLDSYFCYFLLVLAFVVFLPFLLAAEEPSVKMIPIFKTLDFHLHTQIQTAFLTPFKNAQMVSHYFLIGFVEIFQNVEQVRYSSKQISINGKFFVAF